jgi:5-(carboxyamino)imidazole ribonucleotide synthase
MTIGVLGGGQLGRMLALAGYPLGLRFRFLDSAPQAPAGQVAEQVVGAFEDPAALERFRAGLEVVTYEFENVPVTTVRALAEHVPVFPPPGALEIAQDRLAEKTGFVRHGIPTPPFRAVNTRAELDRALADIGLPAVLKTRRFGYDGKGQKVLRQAGDTESAWNELHGVPLLLEGFVKFERELSVLAVRSRTGDTAFYPLVENHHHGGILRLSRAPAPGLAPSLQALAEDHARRIMAACGYVGVLAIEFFQHEGRLLANEMAPRVHNSGHWTIEGAQTSQFENHLRAILGLPLGSTQPRGHSAMLNLIGVLPDCERLLRMPGAHLHLYGKTPRPGRKLGHVTCCADEPGAIDAWVNDCRAVIDGVPTLAAPGLPAGAGRTADPTSSEAMGR